MKEAPFRRTLVIVLSMLIVQFLLGMAVNLFVTIPTNHPGANPPEYFGGVVTSVQWAILHGGLWLTLHAVWGLVLVLAALGTLVQAIRLGGGGRIMLAALGFVGVLGAGFNGGSFLNYHEDFSSMLMSVGLALAMSAYCGAALRQAGAGNRSSLSPLPASSGIAASLALLKVVTCLR
jgi:hypothetical protein